MPEENIRTYQFNVPGFIPGVPGMWSGGSWVTINEDTKQVLDWGPKPVIVEAAPQANSASIEGQAGVTTLNTPPAQSDIAQQLSDALKNL